MADIDEAAQVQDIEPSGGTKLDEIISSAIDQVEGAQAPPKPDADSEPSERPRDERGRFASKEPADDDASTTEPAAPDAKPAEKTAAETSSPEKPLEPPAKWSEADKAEFSKAPRPLQEYLLRRDRETEADYTRKTQELSEARKVVEPLVAEVGKWSPYLQQLGMTPDKAFDAMLAAEYNLRTGSPEQQANGIAHLIGHYRIDPAAVLKAMGVSINQAGEAAKPDQHIATLNHRIAQLESELRGFAQQSQLSERQRAEAEFGALAHAKDATGQAKFPHFERVKQVMIQLAASGQADTWEAAYSKAVRLDDDLHREVIESERKRALETAEKARQEAVDKAKKAPPVKTSSAAPRGDTKKKGLDAILDAAMTQAGIV